PVEKKAVAAIATTSSPASVVMRARRGPSVSVRRTYATATVPTPRTGTETGRAKSSRTLVTKSSDSEPNPRARGPDSRRSSEKRYSGRKKKKGVWQSTSGEEKSSDGRQAEAATAA